ncbi:hemopexin repeat-containing protein [Streptomyces sp. NPDC001920]
MKEYFRVSLDSAQRYSIGEPVLVTFRMENVSDRDVWILAWNTPLETATEVLDYFRVRFDGLLVPYDGRYVKRGEPDAASYRLIRAGETVTEIVDLTTAYPIDSPGTYNVTLETQVLDAVVRGHDEAEVSARLREEHQGFELDQVQTTFEVVEGGEPRTTVAEKVRGELGGIQPPGGPAVARVAALAPVLVGGTSDRQEMVRAAHENAGVYAHTAMQQLKSTPGSVNELSAGWFGTHDPIRYTTVQQHFTDISGAIAGQSITYDLTGAGCQPGWYAYTYKNTRKVWLCASFWSATAVGTDCQFGTVAHELSHAVSLTDDLAYGESGARNLASTQPAQAIQNADNHEYFTEHLATSVVRAPVVWPSGKAYMFVAGSYFRYDVAADKVDAGYPKPISSNWPGLFGDRVDAAVVWPNGKAYFFRGSQYIRVDIATKKADAGYPKPISSNWPGLFVDGVDAAVVWPNGKAYFFRGSQYVRYDIAADKVDSGYPQPITANWAGLWPADLGGAVVWNNGKAYFFQGQQYISFDVAADAADSGYPKSVAGNWPGLP